MDNKILITITPNRENYFKDGVEYTRSGLRILTDEDTINFFKFTALIEYLLIFDFLQKY